MTKFVPIYDLSKLPEDERNAYYLRACEHFKIPADLNLLELLWLDDGYSQRKLVLYAKKGATDILRGNLGISVDEMTKEVANDVVTFTAKGHDATGRTDIATGAAVIKNLSGQKLEFAYMTAQTRATRRLTLQFVGGGLLDESEVLHGAVSNATSSVVAQMATQASVPAPNMQPGKDITELKIDVITAAVEDALIPLAETPKGRRLLRHHTESPSADIPESQRTPTPEDLIENWKSYPVPDPGTKKYEVSTYGNIALETIAAGSEIIKNMSAALQAELKPIYDVPPSAEQAAVLRAKMYHYINEVLIRQGGMVPSENIGGGYNKLKAFILKEFPAVTDLKELSLGSWNDLFTILGKELGDRGPKGLVQYIDSVVEAK